jgi:hypothetical protein
MKNETIIVRVTKQMKADIKEIAKEEGRSVSNYILWILRNKINERKLVKSQDFSAGNATCFSCKYSAVNPYDEPCFSCDGTNLYEKG